MKEIRDPGTPVPDVVPPELVAVYGDLARRTVRRRRSLRFRAGQRVRNAVREDVWFLTASVLLWGVVAASIGASATLAILRWPHLAALVLAAAVLSAAAFGGGFVFGARRRRLG